MERTPEDEIRDEEEPGPPEPKAKISRDAMDSMARQLFGAQATEKPPAPDGTDPDAVPDFVSDDLRVKFPAGAMPPELSKMLAALTGGVQVRVDQAGAEGYRQALRQILALGCCQSHVTLGGSLELGGYALLSYRQYIVAKLGREMDAEEERAVKLKAEEWAKLLVGVPEEEYFATLAAMFFAIARGVKDRIATLREDH